MDMAPPPAVVEFAEKHGYTNGIDYVGKWNSYIVYMPVYSKSEQNTFQGLPQYIMLKDNNIRWANSDEQESLMDLN